MEGVLDVEGEVEVPYVALLHALVQRVEDIELHVVEGLEEGLDELALEREQLGELLLQQVVEVVEFLGRLLHVVLGLPHGLLVLGRLLLLLPQLLERRVVPVEIQLLVLALHHRLPDDLEDVEQLVRRPYHPRVDHLQLGGERALELLDDGLVLLAGADALGVALDHQGVRVGHAPRYGLVDLRHRLAELDLVVEHAVDGVEVLLALIVEALRLGLELLEPPL